VGSEAEGIDRLAEVVSQLEGLPVPASVLERDVLAARVHRYQPRLLDELCAAGEVVWVGRGALARDDGRIALYRRDRIGTLAPPPVDPPDGDVHARIRAFLQQRGASFYRDIYAAAGGGPERTMLDALWDLAWAGEVTNDTFAPLRALRYKRGGKNRRGAPHLSRLGPPEGAGRWSLVSSMFGAASSTERVYAVARLLLERQGVVTRESVVAESVSGGFAALYPVLKALEESGNARRGYFIDGLGGAQFSLPGAVDRLRAEREPPDRSRALVLAATDPANPYGAALAWPLSDLRERRALQRAAGAYVVLVDGLAMLYLRRGGKAISTLDPFADPSRAQTALAALREIASGEPLFIDRINGQPALESSLRGQFEEAGFEREYMSLVLRPPRPASRTWPADRRPNTADRASQL
jgi:ATP-dependent Lhr-like helicase